MSIIPYVVIGGSVAGLCAAIRIAEAGEPVQVLEKGSFTSPRICGEFLSPECLPILANWEIYPPRLVNQVRFYNASGNSVSMKLDIPAGGMARDQLESQLLSRAHALGVVLRPNQMVENISSSQTGVVKVELSHQEVVQARRVIVSAGRYYRSSPKPKKLKFRSCKGQKAHFQHTDIPNCLEMYVFPGGYWGVIPVASRIVNVAVLMQSDSVLPAVMTGLLSKWEQVDDWIEGVVPQFGIRPQFKIPQVYTVGDAAASIPPITGDGVGMAVTSGVMVAEAALQGDWTAYRNAWKKRYSARIHWGLCLHRLAFSSIMTKCLMQFVKWAPSVGIFLYSRTRE